MSAATGPLLDAEDPAAPPRDNGELVFAEPWESRAFGMAVTLVEAGRFTWDEFREHLVARIAEGETQPRHGETFRYYRCWLSALESLLIERGTLARSEVSDRSAELARRAAGHDHGEIPSR